MTPTDARAGPIRPPEWLWLLAALTITAAVYLPSLHYGFVYDDHNQIENNPLIQSWHYLPRAFAGHLWAQKTAIAIYYRPIFTLWLMLNYALFGLNAAAWHASALALHLLATALVYFLALRLTRRQWTSGIASLLFGLNPIHVEAVDWLSGATEPLSASLLLAALLAYFKARETGQAAWMAVALAASLLSDLAHESGVVIVALVFAYEWVDSQPRPLLRRLRRAAWAALPFLAVILLYAGMRLAAIQTLAERHNPYSVRQLLLALPASALFYVKHLVVPIGLSVFYNLSVASFQNSLRAALACLALAILAAAMWICVRRSPLLEWLALWIFVTLLPAFALLFFNSTELVHDRYLYLPSVAFSILIAMALDRLRSDRAAPAALALAVCLAAAYGAGTAYEGSFWRDGLALNERGVAIAPGNEVAMHNLGVELMLAQRDIDAIPYFLRVLQADPRSEETLFALGICYFNLDMLDDAAGYFNRAIAVSPSDPKPHLLLGRVLDKQSRLGDAEREIRRAIALLRVPRGFKAYHLALADVLAEKGDVNGALKEYQAELDNDPGSVEARAGAEKMETILRGQGAK